MSRSRQTAAASRRRANAPLVGSGDESRPVSAIAADFPQGQSLARHRHRRAQLVYAVEGVMTVETEAGFWVVPPLRALWLPPLVDHAIRMTGTVRMRTVYFDGTSLTNASLPDRPVVLGVSPLMRELVVRIVESLFRDDGDSRPVVPCQKAVALLVDELREAPTAALELPVPTDSRLRRITDALRRDPADSRDAAAWARVAGMSERTLARVFPEQTGMTLGRWRQQVRLLRALERLAIGDSVTTVTMELGYGSVSAFVRLFRDSFGVTPGRWLRGEESAPRPPTEENP